MINKSRYEELERWIFENENIEDIFFYKLKERIQTDWENNQNELEFLIQTYAFPEMNMINRIKELEQDKKFLQELANKYGVELE